MQCYQKIQNIVQDHNRRDNEVQWSGVMGWIVCRENLYIDVLMLGISECDCIWRPGL